MSEGGIDFLVSKINKMELALAHKQEECDQLAHEVVDLQDRYDCNTAIMKARTIKMNILREALERIADCSTDRGMWQLVEIAREALQRAGGGE